MRNVPAFVIRAIIKEGTVTLVGVHPETSIRLMGSTMTTAVAAGSSFLSSLTLYPEAGKPGIVAVNIYAHANYDQKGRRNTFEMSGFLHISWKESLEASGTFVPEIDLQEFWIPTKRIGVATRLGVEAVLSGRRFSSHKASYEKNDDIAADGNLLCKYLFGDISAEQMLQALIDERLEPNRQQRIDTLEGEKRKLECRVRDLFDGNQALLACQSQFRRQRDDALREVASQSLKQIILVEAIDEMAALESMLKNIFARVSWRFIPQPVRAFFYAMQKVSVQGRQPDQLPSGKKIAA